MKRRHFSTIINATREAVWQVMLAPDTYRLWTAEFADGSYFEGSWAKGERIRFLAPNGEGMTSVIAENRPHEFLSIKHVGFIKNGIEDTESEEVRRWAPAFENYSFSDVGQGTEVKVEMDVTPEYEEYFVNTWPKALSRLKNICEARSVGVR
jgi:uncharacterized protein YndB with AHSA1/START domain